MKLSHFRVVIGITTLAAIVSLMPGCGGDQYPPTLKYGLRTDPIVMAGAEKLLGEERYDPDQPGVFPLMKISDMNKPDHPYHAKSDKIDDKVLRDPGMVPDKDRKEIEEALELFFGTPANPIVNAQEMGFDPKIVDELKLDPDTLKKGGMRYRLHCLHCHGVPGNGRGPTARWINPHPRDFRAGLFKFMSVDQTQRTGLPPARADLMRTLRHGIEGTAMPSFTVLPDDELESLVSYVIHLSMRGSAEQVTIGSGFDFNKANGGLAWNGGMPLKDYMKRATKNAAKRWHDSQNPSHGIDVKKYPYDPDNVAVLAASVKRGQEIFTAQPSEKTIGELAGKLFPSVHDLAKSAAQDQKNAEAEQKKKDEAKKKNPKLTEDELDKIVLSKAELAKLILSKEELAGIQTASQKKANEDALGKLKAANCVSCHNNYGRQALYRFDLWGTLVRPNNLTTGNLRGGKRPVDIYYRVHSGISGSGMTPFGKTFEGQEHYIWDLVNFVQNLPYPAMRKSLDIRIN